MRPMEPVSYPEPFNEPGWTFQVKWDGVRMLTLWTGAEVQLVNRKGANRTVQYPEIAELQGAFPPGTVLDGELVVLATGEPKFDLILKREQRRRVAAIKHAREQWPVTYAVFDLLYWRSKDIRGRSLVERQATLADIWPTDAPHLHLVEDFSQGEELFRAVGELGWEGVVAKRLESVYTPGRSRSEWRKIKHWRYITCAVGGYTLRDGLPSALLLGVYVDAQLVYVGRAASGLASRDWQSLLNFFRAAEISYSPFSAALPAAAQRETRWVEPLLAVKIRFMEWSSDHKLRAPVILGLLPATQASCNLYTLGGCTNEQADG